MKKTLVVSLLMVVVLMLVCTGVNAVNYRDILKAKILEEAKNAGITIGENEINAALPAEVSEEQYNAVVGEINDMKAEYGETKFEDLSKADKEALLESAQAAASVFDITITAQNGNITVTNKAGNTIASRTYDANGIKTAQQTGSDNLVYVVLAGVAIIAIAGTVVVKKARANA